MYVYQVLTFFLDAFREQSRPQDQLIQAASLLILPMLEAGYAAGQVIVDDDALNVMVTNIFDPPDDLASEPCPFPTSMPRTTLLHFVLIMTTDAIHELKTY